MENHQELEEGQIVLCTVEKILGTTIFVKIHENGEGTIITSEISPGRIRNLRDYVVPNKKIVCKILKIQGNKIYLSLRRVKPSEKKELLDKISKEKSYKAILKTVLKQDAEKIIEDIIQEHTILDFFEQLKTKPKFLEKYTNKKQAEQIIKILKSKKEKEKQIKQNFKLSSNASDGIKIIKKILSDSCKSSKCSISYLAAGKYRISLKGDDFKTLKTEIHSVLNNIEKQAKKQNCEFSEENN